MRHPIPSNFRRSFPRPPCREVRVGETRGFPESDKEVFFSDLNQFTSVSTFLIFHLHFHPFSIIFQYFQITLCHFPHFRFKRYSWIFKGHPSLHHLESRSPCRASAKKRYHEQNHPDNYVQTILNDSVSRYNVVKSKILRCDDCTRFKHQLTVRCTFHSV